MLESMNWIEMEGPLDPKVTREMARLTTYYNSGQALSRTRSGRTFDGDSDSDSDDSDDSDAVIVPMTVE